MLQLRATLPGRRLVLRAPRPTAGRPWAPAGVRLQLTVSPPKRVYDAGSRPISRATPTRSKCPARRAALVIQRQLGTPTSAITSVYLRGIDNTELVHAVHERPSPVIPATDGL